MRFFLFLAFLAAVNARVINFETDGGAKADDNSWATVWKNGAAMNTTLAQLKPGDTLLVPNKKYYIKGGIQVHKTYRFSAAVVTVACALGERPRVGYDSDRRHPRVWHNDMGHREVHRRMAEAAFRLLCMLTNASLRD